MVKGCKGSKLSQVVVPLFIDTYLPVILASNFSFCDQIRSKQLASE